MTLARTLAAACAATLLATGAASAAPASPQRPAVGAPAPALVSVTGSSMMGKHKQRHRTRLDRCNNVPSRC